MQIKLCRVESNRMGEIKEDTRRGINNIKGAYMVAFQSGEKKRGLCDLNCEMIWTVGLSLGIR